MSFLYMTIISCTYCKHMVVKKNGVSCVSAIKLIHHEATSIGICEQCPSVTPCAWPTLVHDFCKCVKFPHPSKKGSESLSPSLSHVHRVAVRRQVSRRVCLGCGSGRPPQQISRVRREADVHRGRSHVDCRGLQVIISQPLCSLLSSLYQATAAATAWARRSTRSSSSRERCFVTLSEAGRITCSCSATASRLK